MQRAEPIAGRILALDLAERRVRLEEAQVTLVATTLEEALRVPAARS
jgi:hypothetical protein